MTFMQKEGFFFSIIYWTWKILTWGWIAKILFGMSIILLIMFFTVVIADLRIIKYTIREKFRFLKFFAYLFLIQSIWIMKSHFITFRWQVSKWDNYFLSIVIIGIIFFIGFAYFTIPLMWKIIYPILQFI